MRHPLRVAGDADQGGAEVPLHVHRQRLQGGNVEHPAPLLLARVRREHQAVDGSQERRQGLAGAGRRQNQGVLPGLDNGPGQLLRARGGLEGMGKPRLYGLVEPGQRGMGRPPCGGTWLLGDTHNRRVLPG